MKTSTASLSAALAFLALSCQGSTLGSGCTIDADCSAGESCFDVVRGFPGGYCARGCTREGDTADCPGGSICTRTTSTSSPTVFCSTPCTDDSACRGGAYACRSVTGSSQKACAP